MPDSPLHPRALGRRQALTGVAGVGLALPVLAACGGDGGSPASDSTPSSSTSGSGSANGAGGALTTTAEVPVGGGTILSEEKVVVTQPSAGTFVAFSVTCTHQGCPVTAVSETIDCSCHGSRFSLEDGSVVQGPATEPLDEVGIRVQGDEIVRN